MLKCQKPFQVTIFEVGFDISPHLRIMMSFQLMQTTEEVMNPNMKLPQLKFLLSSPEGVCPDKEAVREELLKEIYKNDMAPYYLSVCTEFDWQSDPAQLIRMRSENEAQLKKFADQLDDAETNAGETEIREALLARAEYFSKIGDKAATLETFDKVFAKSVGIGNKLDVILHLIRIGMFFSDSKLITANIEKAKKMIEEGGDWDRRNRLKVYEASYLMSIRDFKSAANSFLDALPTFTCTELMSYSQFVQYTIICSTVALDRVTIRKKVIYAPEVLEVIRDLPHFDSYLNSLYKCDYKSFFLSLAEIEQYLKGNFLLNAHYRYYTREMRIKAYAQLLESYRSLTIESMAESFGVTEESIDRELSRFIATGRLHCVIDKVGGVVITNRPDTKNSQYQNVIKHGDVLLNRVQKLSRVMNV